MNNFTTPTMTITDVWAILDEFEEIEEEMDDEEEEGWHLAAAMVAAGHGRNHCCAELCRTAPYTGNALVQEFLIKPPQRRGER
jgi:hypothetical protein